MKYTSKQYSEALTSLSTTEQELNNFIIELENFTKVLKSEIKLSKILKNPEVEFSKKQKLLDKIIKSIYIRNFVKVIVKNNNLNIIEKIIYSLKKLKNKIYKTTEAEVFIVDKLSKKQFDKLKNELSKITSKKVNLKQKIDKKIKGGIIIKIEDMLIDGSLAGKLERLGNALRS